MVKVCAELWRGHNTRRHDHLDSQVEKLVKAGAALDGVTWDKTPLMIASANGHLWAVQTLLELGADTGKTNGEMMAALDYARYPDIAELIYEFMQARRILERQFSSFHPSFLPSFPLSPISLLSSYISHPPGRRRSARAQLFASPPPASARAFFEARTSGGGATLRDPPRSLARRHGTPSKLSNLTCAALSNGGTQGTLLSDRPAPDYAKIFREADEHRREFARDTAGAMPFDAAWDGIPELDARWRTDFRARGRRLARVKATWRALCLKARGGAVDPPISSRARDVVSSPRSLDLRCVTIPPIARERWVWRTARRVRMIPSRSTPGLRE